MDVQTFKEISDEIAAIQEQHTMTVDQQLKVLEIRTLAQISFEVASVATQLAR